ncbi:type II toxin-antitoxin system HipA family toxin [Pararhizobium sp. BT-229]|uniref:type II toxin-antitoxin system HipA family toxin n=1 Tax=Pararhizobium sp. BT-229 TaxID=2986923 RepID=UPI0021F724B8|nr:type II toxin-antitoxin system HipA family toxin [Pararhizobium sp. BT-229]MCV9964296.1 type II toxin-antitoxin system HipA family toxin [Pararhizobium sp. BT-229]
MAKKQIFVRIGRAATPVGELIVSTDGVRETSVFQYDRSWLEHPLAFALSPGLRLDQSPYYFNKEDGSSLPPPISDGTPDSWGRAIIKAHLGGRSCTDLDFLLQSSDDLRSGALRYYESREEDAPPLAPPILKPGLHSVPRLIDLDALIVEARAFELDPARYREKRANMIGGDLLKGAVGSLGGARPKINAIDEDGSLWIVKLAKFDDQHSVAHAEVLALTLAGAVGIETAEARIIPSSQKYPIAIVRRFDRAEDGIRIPFISAQTFVDLPGADPGNYADIAFQMMEWSADAESDTQELFRRVAFNILIQNTDDHLRNLGFLYGGGGRWRLSPAFDVNPVPERGTTLKTAISEIHGNELDIDQLIDAAPYFGIDKDAAVGVVSDMATTIKDSWRQIAGRLQMPGKDIRFVAPAFENPQMDRALELKQRIGSKLVTALGG